MKAIKPIYISAALVTGVDGNLLLVRKRGSRYFMQPGGKIEVSESARTALVRELNEEVGIVVDVEQPRYLGVYDAVAANEPGCYVRCELFEVFTEQTIRIGAEIEEAIWVGPNGYKQLLLAPLTRDYVIPKYIDEYNNG